MCFGAGSSFVASAVLAVSGGATLQKVRKGNEFLFGLFPVLFALQQLNEGLLWLVLTNRLPKSLEHILTLGFLSVAFFVWPVYSPLSIYFIEPEKNRRKILVPFILLGIGLSISLFCYFFSGPFNASIVNCSIYYQTLVPEDEWISILYLITIFFPFLFCSYRPIVVMGIINIIFCGVAYFFYIQTFVSTWCFFASALSVMFYLFFRWLRMSYLK